MANNDSATIHPNDLEAFCVAALSKAGLSEEDARRRVDAQMPTAEKVAQAGFVIRTDGSFKSTDAQADAVCERLLATAQA